ncbi:addiction module protein [Thermodesulfobacteriota bacterium B35]
MKTLDIEKMTTIERLQAMEALWDALLHENTEPESPGWHRDVLEARKLRIARGEAQFLSIKDLKARSNI